MLDRLSNIEDVASVGWIQVDQRPAKQALSVLASKWKHTYASHLERQVHKYITHKLLCYPSKYDALVFPPDIQCVVKLGEIL